MTELPVRQSERSLQTRAGKTSPHWKRLPFRMGPTSFIHRGSWLTNVERLASRFSDIEILCFEGEGAGAFPSDAELAGLATWKAQEGLTYSLHTPLDVNLASEGSLRRRESVAMIRRTLDATAALEPEAVIVHVYLGDSEHALTVPADIPAWRHRAADSLRAILACGLDPATLCVEILDYDFILIAPVVEELGISVAADVGHLLREGRDELDVLDHHLHRTRVIQWHGVDPASRDHRSLVHFPKDRARRLLEMLQARSYRGVVTIEVFGEDDLADSVAIVDEQLLELAP